MHPEIVQDGPGSCPICGMALEPMMPTADAAPNPELADMSRRFWVGLALALPVLVLEMGRHLFNVDALVPPHINAWIQFGLATPVVLWAGWPFFERGYASLVNRSLNMFTLIALGTGVAWIYSVVALLFPSAFPPEFRGPHGDVAVYFEAAAVITVLVLLGQVLELGARERTGGAIRALLDLAPKTARRISGSRQFDWTQLAMLGATAACFAVVGFLVHPWIVASVWTVPADLALTGGRSDGASNSEPFARDLEESVLTEPTSNQGVPAKNSVDSLGMVATLQKGKSFATSNQSMDEGKDVSIKPNEGDQTRELGQRANFGGRMGGKGGMGVMSSGVMSSGVMSSGVMSSGGMSGGGMSGGGMSGGGMGGGGMGGMSMGVDGRGGGMVDHLDFDQSKLGVPASPDNTLMMTVTPRIIIPVEPEEESKMLSGGAGRLTDDLSRGRNARDNNQDRYDSIIENPFLATESSPVSTFSIDVDSASYSKVRQFLLSSRQLPPPGAVRIEELINYFQYHYAPPTGDLPFSSALAVAQCPWHPKHQLVRIALQAKKIEKQKRPLSNLVFLLDVSGSMNQPDKLPLVQDSMRLLTNELTENDRVAIVVYAGAAGVVLESTTGDKKQTILDALNRLSAGGSTNGGAGIEAAYRIAREHFITGGSNRVILCSDGDFNVGTTSNDALVALVEENAKSKVFLTVLGFGMGDTNDSMMEQITNRGNGFYGFIDSHQEAHRMLVDQLSGSLDTVAKDVKVQVEFNPLQVSGYRLLGYENRMLATEDFNNDKKDAGDIGAGHNVTALYEIIPNTPIADPTVPGVDASRYQTSKEYTQAAQSGELLVVKVRYKHPEGETSLRQEFPLLNADTQLEDCDEDFRWSASMAQFGMLLRRSKFQGDSNWDALLETVGALAKESQDTFRLEAFEMILTAKNLFQSE